MLDSHGTLSLSFRNHLKDVPEAVSESQHVAYSHCELGKHWVGCAWGALGAISHHTQTLRVASAHGPFQGSSQDSTDKTQDKCMPFPEFPERTSVPEGLDRIAGGR